jgi:primosomal protein N' (replication factor Y)
MQATGDETTGAETTGAETTGYDAELRVAAPVARVAIDSPLPHLDRLFDYRVPAELDEAAQPGVRVKVRFAGRLANGFLLERVERSDHEGVLSPLAKVVSPERVLVPEIAALARRVADRGAGTLSDVLRLAVPPRHARAEKSPPRPPAAPVAAPELRGWYRYAEGPSFLAALADGRFPRAVWPALAGSTWPEELATAVQAALSSGRGVVVALPDVRDAERLAVALRAAVGEEAFVVLTADLGPAERYRRFLAVSRGAVRAVIGTRAAAFAPVRDLGLVAIWDDGDDLHAEPRAPYPHIRDVLMQRAHLGRAGALIGGHAPSVDAEVLVESGWARALTAGRADVRLSAPRVEVAGSDTAVARDPAARSARLPTLAFDAVRRSLAAGHPVLVQVPRRGYQVGLSCADCRTPARCSTCGGPLARTADGRPPVCGWCAGTVEGWSCAHCSGTRLRAGAVGERRTAEELGRAFPATTVHTSAGETVLAEVGADPALVVATPGAEPVATGGYGAVLLLDAWSLLGRPDLRAAEEALRRWINAASLARPATEGGAVVLVGADAAVPAVQALVRWDPLGFAAEEERSRRTLGFPPAVRLAAVEGDTAAANSLVDAVLADPSLADLVLARLADVLGPVPLDETTERLLVRVPRASGPALAKAVANVQRARSPRKDTPVVRVRLDPAEIG